MMPIPKTPDSPEDDGNTVNVELMLRVKLGGKQAEDAFQELIELHQNAVIGTVAKMLGNSSDAEDIAQQVFIRLWKSAPRYEVKAKFTTFLYTITRNLVFNETKRKQRKKEHSLDEQQENSFTQIEDKVASRPDKEILQAELKSEVDKAIHNLPEKQRLAVILRRFENMPYEEIADVLELSVSAVKSQLFRARTALRESLSHYLDQS
ncbi:MAG: RNA polymerase sigma-70 factor (ECF subfamily) [Cryomorphaceae bacterium]|jgi:RNA polymerase sigma-70 factor (ECF subfamily)